LAQFFITVEPRDPPSYWSSGQPPEGKGNFPVTNVSWREAKEYAVWISKKEGRKCTLPTELQWEFAARNGSQATPYPWGADWKAGNAKLGGDSAVEVSTSNDQTFSGVRDMLGNVAEWTSSEYSLYDGHPNRLVNKNRTISVRGISYFTTSQQLAKPQWLLTFRNSVPENEKLPFVGFRLVCDS